MWTLFGFGGLSVYDLALQVLRFGRVFQVWGVVLAALVSIPYEIEALKKPFPTSDT